MKKFKICILFVFLILVLDSCASFQVVNMTSSNMNQLELGMSKEEVTQILGRDYTIAEKRLEDNNEIEVLSYKNFYESNEYYLFVFKNHKLEKWYRELLLKEKQENK